MHWRRTAKSSSRRCEVMSAGRRVCRRSTSRPADQLIVVTPDQVAHSVVTPDQVAYSVVTPDRTEEVSEIQNDARDTAHMGGCGVEDAQETLNVGAFRPSTHTLTIFIYTWL
jgi:hypothetical protein